MRERLGQQRRPLAHVGQRRTRHRAVAPLAPALLLGPLLGGLADRVDRRRLLVAVNLVLAAVMVAVAAGPVWLLFGAPDPGRGGCRAPRGGGGRAAAVGGRGGFAVALADYRVQTLAAAGLAALAAVTVAVSGAARRR
ncbi:hypothetical protein GCM10018962_48290 [Dactylosporangium matsuzakiense]|uniref:Uncharacterized protein n=1 Tax=Dactylosporangium matsuzakiense TaxID=53360 RepID=A0A9W6KSS8_9ACTN|nr:hypothetical protein GCM10017581_087030 [Dactylosporangium matsuzakiense]